MYYSAHKMQNEREIGGATIEEEYTQEDVAKSDDAIEKSQSVAHDERFHHGVGKNHFHPFQRRV